MATPTQKIFVVPSPDEFMTQTVARFLEQLGLIPIILTTRPNQGMTTLDKLEKASDIGFAIILMTGEERDRQNAIFQLGYMLGKLGPGRVSVLYKRDVEIHSDYGGVNYIPYDEANAWQLPVARELATRGLDINAAKLLPGDSTTDAPPPPPKPKAK